MISNNMPVVSLVMATYNDSPSYLISAIESVINQTLLEWELVIVDDSTNDITKQVLNDFANKDNRIIVIRSKDGKYGFVKALNVGLEAARGEYVGRMDGDDLSRPQRLEKEVNFLKSNSDFDVVGSHTSIIDSKGNITSYIKFPSTGIRFRLFQIMRCPMQHGSILMRRELIDKGVRYDESFKKSEDLELWLRLQKKGYELYNLQEVLYDFRIEDNYAGKRNREHFKYNIRARKKNFTYRYCITNLLGIIVASSYTLVPQRLKTIIYSILNGR